MIKLDYDRTARGQDVWVKVQLAARLSSLTIREHDEITSPGLLAAFLIRAKRFLEVSRRSHRRDF